MPSADDQAIVLVQFGLLRSACTVTELGNAGGFSGARLWRVSDGSRQLCLRRWPVDHPDETRLRFIHAVMEFAGMQLEIVPRLQRTPAGDTAIRHGEHLWELTTWLPGEATYRAQPSPAKLFAAMQALASVHLALEHFPTRMTGNSVSPGIAERRARLRELRALLPQIHRQLPSAAAELRLRGEAILSSFARHATEVDDQLATASSVCVPLQPCLRDIWHDHVLFVGDTTTGIIDFDAVRIETVAGDLARLITSLVGNDPAPRASALAAYETLRPLSIEERKLIEVFDASATLMSGMNWLVWILIDGRTFIDMQRIYARLDESLSQILHRERTGQWCHA